MQVVLNDTVLFKFTFRKGFCDCGSIAVNGIVHFILHCCKEISCDLTVNGIIHSGCVNVCDFLIETALADTNFLNLGNQMLKIVLVKNLTVNQSALVKDISLFGKGVQYLCCPLSELRCPAGVDTVSDGDNGR